MKKAVLRRFVPTVLAGIIVLFSVAAYGGNPELFKPRQGESTSPSTSASWEIRKRKVEADLSLFRQPEGSAKTQTVEERIVFNLFDDVVFTVVFTTVERNADTRMTIWTGKIEGNEKSSITLAISPDSMAGAIKTGTPIFYQIRPMMGGYQTIVEMDESRMPRD
jgi:hypothetical protein